LRFIISYLRKFMSIDKPRQFSPEITAEDKEIREKMDIQMKKLREKSNLINQLQQEVEDIFDEYRNNEKRLNEIGTMSGYEPIDINRLTGRAKTPEIGEAQEIESPDL